MADVPTRKVKMLRSCFIVHLELSVQEGDLVEAPAHLALQWIASGLAEAVADEQSSEPPNPPKPTLPKPSERK